MSVFQTILPTLGPGSLKNREDPNERASKVITTKNMKHNYLDIVELRVYVFKCMYLEAF